MPAKHPPPALPEDYTLQRGAPDPHAYRTLRRNAGLHPVTEAQAAASTAGAWCAFHIAHAPTGTAVAMGRVIGDGAWYFHVIDMATLPEHQRRGLGGAILAALLAEIEARAPPGALVNLLADPPGRALYRKLGFRETGEAEVGMALRVGGE